MDELVQWLGEQLDEDERIARAATERQPYDQWDAVGDDREGETARKHWSVVKIARMEPTPAARDLATFIAAHDPARVLREIEAKRAIVDDLAEEIRWGARKGLDYQDGVDACKRTLKRLALPLADRPGYREEWRP